MPQSLRTLIQIQLFVVVIAQISAVFNVTHILWSFPAMSLAGLAVAVLGYRYLAPAAFALGLSAPTMALLSFCLIIGLDWSPKDALVPIACLQTPYTLLSLVMSPIFLSDSVYGPDEAMPRPQFGLRSIFLLISILAVMFGLVRQDSHGVIALAVFVGYIGLCTYVVHLFRRRFSTSARRLTIWQDLTRDACRRTRYTAGRMTIALGIVLTVSGICGLFRLILSMTSEFPESSISDCLLDSLRFTLLILVICGPIVLIATGVIALSKAQIELPGESNRTLD